MFKTLFFCLYPLFVFGHITPTLPESSHLQLSDINAIMKELFSKHIDQKSISTEIIQDSFRNYITQFDPIKVYLLKKEVESWAHMSELQLLKLVSSYQKGDFSAYEQLNGKIQEAIDRSRDLRRVIEMDPGPLFAAKSTNFPTPAQFAQDEDELSNRLRQEIIFYIGRQKDRFGENQVIEKQAQVLENFEKSIRSFEDQYLYVDHNGDPKSSQQNESLLVMHVLKAMAKSLDANTAFFTPTEAYDMKLRLEKGSYDVGLVFQEGLDGIHVANILEGSPAAKDGRIEKKDKLIAIDQEKIKDYSFNDVLKKIHLDNREKITFTLEKETPKETYDVTLKKEPIKVDVNRVDIGYQPFGSGIIGHIALHSFYDNDEGIDSASDVRAAIHNLEHIAPLRGIILDLRDNLGGFLTQAVEVAGLFITNGVVVISKYANGEEHFYRDIDGKTSFEGPIVVLVSRQTASAAEIVAQALQDYGVAIVVGDDRTYGKGSIQSQTVTEPSGSSYFKVTVGKYYTVSGKSPEKEGVKSDIVVPGPLMLSENHHWADVKGDTLPSAFTDTLIDINDEAKPWFLKYYMPHLQHPSSQLREMLPTLISSSQYRIDNDKNYSLFLKKRDPATEDDDGIEELYVRKGAKNFGVEDLQLQEAYSIISDMIRIESKGQSIGSAR